MLFDREYNLSKMGLSDGTSPSTAALGAQYGLDDSHRTILYAGTFEPYQGLELLVDASPMVVQACEAARFLCLGGSRSQVAAVGDRARQHGVADRFILPGTIPAEHVEQHFKIATLLVSPRILGTNTPLKIYSYLRSGLPIVATSILSHTQVLTPDVAVLVEPRPEALAEGIVKVIEDSQLSQRLVQGALKLARNAYSAETYHSKVAEVFSFLASRSQAGH